MIFVVQSMDPAPSLRTRKLPPGLVSAPPETAVMMIGMASRNSLGGTTTGALQSPSCAQSLSMATAANRGMGAVADAVAMVDTGASATVSWATAGAVNRGREINTGNWADSRAEELESTTS